MPEELAEGLVVGDGLVVVLGEAVLDVFQAPLVHQLAGRLGFLQGKNRREAASSFKVPDSFGLCFLINTR